MTHPEIDALNQQTVEALENVKRLDPEAARKIEALHKAMINNQIESGVLNSQVLNGMYEQIEALKARCTKLELDNNDLKMRVVSSASFQDFLSKW